MNRVRFDMHCHTAEGSPDAKVKILDYIDLLKQRGFHGMLVTDHDSYSGYKAYLRQKDKVKDFTVLRGIEYDTFDYGHFLIVLPSDTPEEVYDLFEHRGMALIRVIWLVHECGGILGPAHPFGEKFMSFGSTRRLGMIEHRLYAQHFDFIEGYNCCESAKKIRWPEGLRHTMIYLFLVEAMPIRRTVSDLQVHIFRIIYIRRMI